MQEMTSSRIVDMREVLREIEEGLPERPTTGIPEIDETLGGLHDGLYVLAVAKRLDDGGAGAVLAAKIAENVARTGRRVLYLGLERPTMTPSVPGVIAWEDAGVTTIEAIKRAAGQLVSMDGRAPVIIADRMELLTPTRPGASLQEDMNHVAGELHGLGLFEVHAPVLCVCGTPEAPTDGPVEVIEIAGTGEVENVAVGVIGLWPDGKPGDQVPETASVAVLKNRFGPTSRARVMRLRRPSRTGQPMVGGVR